LEVLVIQIREHNLLLGSKWLKSRKLEVDWATGRLTSSRTAIGQGEALRSDIIVQWYEGRADEITDIQLPDIGGSTLTIYST